MRGQREVFIASVIRERDPGGPHCRYLIQVATPTLPGGNIKQGGGRHRINVPQKGHYPLFKNLCFPLSVFVCVRGPFWQLCVGDGVGQDALATPEHLKQEPGTTDMKGETKEAQLHI